MKWRTEVVVPGGSPKIGYADQVLTLGSCFADHLGARLSYCQFPHVGNPFGVIFHPEPLAALLRRASEGKPFTREDLFSHQDRWGSLQAHSSLSGNTASDALQALNHGLQNLRMGLECSTHTVITLGTAYGYRYLEDGGMVANCHKLPASAFRRELTHVESIYDFLEEICELARSFNAEMTCLFTVSPIRHIRDGLVENQRSKAHLITAVHRIVDAGLAGYFPSYELLMDELRDYRFYDRDLIHPNGQAVDYIWEQFAEAWVAEDARKAMKEVEAVQKGLSHRPLSGDSEAYRKFRDTLKSKIKSLRQRYPHMDFGDVGAG